MTHPPAPRMLVLRNEICGHPVVAAQDRAMLLRLQVTLVRYGRRDFRITTLSSPEALEEALTYIVDRANQPAGQPPCACDVDLPPIVHQRPPDGWLVTPCCRLPLADMTALDRVQIGDEPVTCEGLR